MAPAGGGRQPEPPSTPTAPSSATTGPSTSHEGKPIPFKQKRSVADLALAATAPQAGVGPALGKAEALNAAARPQLPRLP
eukprot:3377290-Pyramimonas_sp.AAC.1